MLTFAIPSSSQAKEYTLLPTGQAEASSHLTCSNQGGVDDLNPLLVCSSCCIHTAAWCVISMPRKPRIPCSVLQTSPSLGSNVWNSGTIEHPIHEYPTFPIGEFMTWKQRVVDLMRFKLNFKAHLSHPFPPSFSSSSSSSLFSSFGKPPYFFSFPPSSPSPFSYDLTFAQVKD